MSSKEKQLLPHQFQPGNPGGPGPLRKYQGANQLQVAVDGYFEKCDTDKEPPSMSSLALHLGFTNRLTLLKYRQYPGYEEFHEIIETAKLRIEAYLEKVIVTKPHMANGVKFVLSNNFREWNQTFQIQASTSGEVDYSKLSEEKRIQLINLLKEAKNG